MEAGKLDIIIEDLNTSEVPDLLVQQFGVLARQKQLTFSVSLDEGVPAVIYTDPQRVQQILRNLLSNAFKFTMTGGVTMNIRVVERQEGLLHRNGLPLRCRIPELAFPGEA